MITRASHYGADPLEPYANYCRPKLADLLGCLELDVEYIRASGAYLYRAGSDGQDEPILDLVGGFGAALFGHNNEELKACIRDQLERNVPFMAQSSLRAEAGRLARRINDLLPGESRYICHLSNSGAEAVEAALKHAYKVSFDRTRRLFDRVARQIERFYRETESRYPDVQVPGGDRDLGRFRDDLDEHNIAELERFQNNPVVLALKGAFHGKTAGALKVTFNKTYREGFEGLSGVRPHFLDPNDLYRLDEIEREHEIKLLVPTVVDGKIIVERVASSTVIALMLEVIQGEGGIRPLPADALEAVAEHKRTSSLPIIVDEIQTGCGRTGAVVAYADTPLSQIVPEYVTLGKALGGGLVKIGGVMIREDVYDHDFGLLHTSTFAEDEIACVVADTALDMLTRDDGAYLTEIREKGRAFLTRLRALKDRFPDVLSDVRGRGLMIGVEFAELRDRSPFFRFGARQGFLSLVVASYLLHYHGIRMLAPLTTLMKGNPGKKRMSVLRVQPAADITEDEMDRVLGALTEVCTIIRRNNEGVLIRHLFGADVPERERIDPPEVAVANPARERHVDFDARIGFVMHPTRVEDIIRFYLPSLLGQADVSAVAGWWSRLSRFLEPDVVHTEYIASEGFVVESNFVSVAFLPRYLGEAYTRARDPDVAEREDRIRLREIQDKIQDAVTTARELGDDHIPTSVVGLGAYTSIVTDRGTLINDYEVPVTTGNAYTTGLMIQGIERAAEERGIELSDARAAVVGAAGNIGSVLSTILSTHVSGLRLVGREGPTSLERLKQARLQCLLHLAAKAREQVNAAVPIEEVRVGGLGDRILHDIVLPALAASDEASGWGRAEAWLREGDGVSPELGSLLEEALDRHGGPSGNDYISLHESVKAVADCDIVTVATSSPEARLVSPETVKRGAVVSCASVPSNLSDAFRDHMDEYLAFDGGYARLPEGHTVECVGLPSGGLAHGCFSETLMLGFDGRNSSFAHGRLRPELVEETLDMAEIYGFELGKLIIAGGDS